VLGPTTQKQANKSRQAIEGPEDVGDETFDAASNFENDSSRGFGHTDGGRDDVEKNNGLDVIRTD
jgi:cell division protein FtsZ